MPSATVQGPGPSYTPHEIAEASLLALIAAIEPIITENRRDTIQSFGSEALAIPHLKIYEAIKRQDPDGAALAMERHLKELRGYLFRRAVA